MQTEGTNSHSNTPNVSLRLCRGMEIGAKNGVDGELEVTLEEVILSVTALV